MSYIQGANLLGIPKLISTNHAALLRSMLADYAAGEGAMLLVGNQVGQCLL